MQKYVIWDWNGTLLDDVGAAVGALNRMLARRGLGPVTRDFYRARFGFPVRPFYALLGLDLSRENWDAICEDFHRFIADEPDQHPRPGIPALLDALRARGWHSCILSALREDILRRDVAAAGLADRFDRIFGVDNLDGATKLSRGQDLVATLRALSPEPPQLVFVGDTLHDAEVARALGGACLLLDAGHQTPERLAAAGCPVLHTLTDILNHLPD